MDEYPLHSTLVYDSVLEVPTDGTEVLRAEDGTPWIYHRYTGIYYDISFLHRGVTIAERQMIENFYYYHRETQFTFTRRTSGRVYTCVFAGPPVPRAKINRVRWDIAVQLIGSLTNNGD